MTKTTNYQLNQWAKSDRIMMDDFNADNQKIDAALAACGNCKIATGSYTGTGEYGAEHPNTLTFDFAPKVIIVRKGYESSKQQLFIFSGMTGVMCEFQWNSDDRVTLSWSNNGKTVSWYAENALKQLNSTYEGTYYYLAVG